MKFTVVLVAFFLSVAVAHDYKETCQKCKSVYKNCMAKQCPDERVGNNGDCDHKCQKDTCGELPGQKRNVCAKKCDFFPECS